MKGKQLLARAAADIQDLHPSLRFEQIKHPLIDVATAVPLVDVDPGLQILCGLLIINRHLCTPNWHWSPTTLIRHASHSSPP